MEQREIRSSGVKLTPICFGTSALGDMPETYGYTVAEDRAKATVGAILDGPVNCLDTSRNYGFGRSEERIGQVIAERGLPEGFIISTKLDRDMKTGGFDAGRARQSLEESLRALGLSRIPLLHLHDPEHAANLDEITGKGGALDALIGFREEGLVDAVGLAMGRLDLMFPLLRRWDFDALISHNRFTLLNRSASEMFDWAQEQGIAVLNAAPFAGGVLAKGSAVMPKISYSDADAEALAPVRAIELLCSRYGVAPGAAALQFSMRDPRVTSTVVGVSKPERVQQTLDWAAAPIPAEFWQAVEALPYSNDDPEAHRVYNPG